MTLYIEKKDQVTYWREKKKKEHLPSAQDQILSLENGSFRMKLLKQLQKKKKKRKRNKLRELKHGHKQQIGIPQPISEEEKKNHSLLRFYFVEFFCTFQMYCMLVSFDECHRLFICTFYINEYN